MFAGRADVVFRGSDRDLPVDDFVDLSDRVRQNVVGRDGDFLIAPG